MKELIPLSRTPHYVTFHSDLLKKYRNADQLSFALTALRIRAVMISVQVPFCNTCLDWPPIHVILGDYSPESPEVKLYHLLYQTVGLCGFPVSAIQDVEVFSHDPKKTTVLNVNARRRIISVQ